MEDVRKCHLCDEPTVNKYCENEDCEVNQRDEKENEISDEEIVNILYRDFKKVYESICEYILNQNKDDE